MKELERVINNFPTQLSDGWELADGQKIEGQFNKIIVCGMGGSALPGRILSIIMADLYKSKLVKKYFPVIVSAGYELPPETDTDSLILCLSYSGNTEETLAAYKQARDAEFNIFCLASGGKLKELAQKNATPFLEIPAGVQPRMALGYFIGAILHLLTNSKIFNFEKSVKETAKQLELNLLNLKKQAQKISKSLKNKIPVVYASDNLAVLAMIWKINFNENVKIPAYFNEIPEMNHNEINGFEKLTKDLSVIILKSQTDLPRIGKRMEALAKVLIKKKVAVQIIELVNSPLLLNKLFAAVILSLGICHYLAEEYGIDPIPVPMVEDFKSLIK